MAKEIKYRITLLRFIISTFFTLFIVGCEKGYEVKEKNPTTGGAGGGGEPARAWRRIFITAQDYTGNLGGKAGADAKCMADADKPSSGTYKAMVVGSGREASPTPTDWVLAASTQYRRLDDTTIIGTTDASGLFTPPLSASFDEPASILAPSLTSWTGLYGNWTTSSYTCSDWGNGTNSGYGYVGYTGILSQYEWGYNYYSNYCDELKHIICVEQ